LLRVNSKGKRQRGRRREGEEIGERRRRGVHWQGRIRPEMPAGVRSSDEQLRGLAASLRRGKERDERGETGVLIAGILMTLTCAK
jgi:hypothetical protein